MFISGDDETDFIPPYYSEKNGDENDDAHVFIDHNYWQQMIYSHHSDDAATESRCAKRCLVSDDKTCNFYTVAHGYCQLGRFNTKDNKRKGSMTKTTIFKLKKSIGIFLTLVSGSVAGYICKLSYWEDKTRS